MMSGLEINATFVSCKKNKYVSDKYEPGGTICRST